MALTGNGVPSQRIEAAALIASCLGADHYLVAKLDGMRIQSHGFAPSLLSDFRGYVDAGASLIDIDPAPLRATPGCDPDLWVHIEELVAIGAWGKIPKEIAIYVEHWYRERGDDPRHTSGSKLIGKDLFARVLGDGNGLSLGNQDSEREGWRFLGMGLAQAVGNLHRHAIEEREDAEQFAWGVIGLGSLLIGEMKRTHPA